MWVDFFEEKAWIYILNEIYSISYSFNFFEVLHLGKVQQGATKKAMKLLKLAKVKEKLARRKNVWEISKVLNGHQLRKSFHNITHLKSHLTKKNRIQKSSTYWLQPTVTSQPRQRLLKTWPRTRLLKLYHSSTLSHSLLNRNQPRHEPPGSHINSCMKARYL